MASNTTVTIRQILLSTQNTENRYDGFDTKFTRYGDYLSFQEVIDDNYKNFWERVRLTQNVTDRFKKDFLEYFYNREIGFEVVAPFFTKLSSVLNTDCYILLKLLETVREMDIDEMLSTIELYNTGNMNGKANAIVETKPKNDLSIVYDTEMKETLIKYADAVNENLQKSETNSKTWGRTTGSKFNALNEMGFYEDIQAQIFRICDKECFLQIWL